MAAAGSNSVIACQQCGSVFARVARVARFRRAAPLLPEAGSERRWRSAKPFYYAVTRLILRYCVTKEDQSHDNDKRGAAGGVPRAT